MTDRPSVPDVPLNRRNFLRSAAASSLALGGIPAQAAATDHNCDQAHECDPRIRCFDPSDEDPQTVARSAGWEGELEESHGTVEATTGLDAMAIYRGRVDFGSGDCYPVWDLLIAWDQHYARSGGDTYNFTHTLNIDVTDSDSADPIDPGDATYWLEQDPADLDGVDPNAADEERELREYYESEGVLSDLEYSDSELLVTGLTVGLNAAVSLSGYGTVARIGAKVLPMLVGMAVGEEASGNDFEYQIAQHHTPDMGERAGFFYLPKFHAKPDGSVDPGDVREFSVDVNVDFFDGTFGPNLQETPDSHSHTLDLQFREDRPSRLTGELNLDVAGGTLEYELRNADGAVLDTLYQELTDDPDDDGLAVEEMDYDVWVSEEEFPLRLVQSDHPEGELLSREIQLSDLDDDLEPYATIEQSLSEQNERVVVDDGGPGDATVDLPGQTSTRETGVYLPTGVDRYATADVGHLSPAVQVTGGSPPGYLTVTGEDLQYFDRLQQSRTERGSAVSETDFYPAGTIWVEGDELRYVDEDGAIRSLGGTGGSSVPGEPGSLWLESGQLAYVGEDGRKYVLGAGGGGDLEVEIEDVRLEPDAVAPGQDVDVTVQYSNTGAAGTDTVRAYIRNHELYSGPFSVAAGSGLTETFTVTPEEQDLDAPSLEVELVDAGAQDETPITVQPDDGSEPNVVIEEFRPGREYAVVGESVEFSATYTNAGGDGDVSNQLYVGDSELIDSTFTMNAGETESGSKTYELTEDHAGAREARLAFDSADESEVRDFTVVGDTVADPRFGTAETDAAAVAAGEPIELTTDWANIADSGTELLRIFVGDRLAHAEVVQIPESGLEWTGAIQTKSRDEGAEEVRVELVTSSQSASASVDVRQPAPDVVATLGDVRDTVLHAASTLEVPATVEHVGGDPATLEVRATTPWGETSERVDVDTGETRSLTQDVDVDPSQTESATVGVEVVHVDSGTVVAGADQTVSVAGPLDDDVTLDGHHPQPLGEDGLYRDITGSGDLSTEDVSVFQANVFSDAVQENPEYFNFSGGDSVSHGDVTTLFQDAFGF